MRGIGDRWLAGEPVEGVELEHGAAVEVAGGALDGRRGTIALLIAVRPEPAYLVALAGGGGDVRVRQSALRRAE